MEATVAKLELPSARLAGVADGVPRAALHAEPLGRGDAAPLAPASALVDGRSAVGYADGPRPVCPAGAGAYFGALYVPVVPALLLGNYSRFC